MNKERNSGVAPKKLTKTEIKANKEEETRLRDLVKNEIYPLLIKGSKNIKDAKNICRTLSVGMDAVFNLKLKEYEKYVSEGPLQVLDLNGNMNSPEEYPIEHAITDLLNLESVSVAKGLIEGMEAELNRLTDKELLERPLDTLKTEWL